MERERDPDESIYGRTETVFTAPDLNAGAPAEPLALRILSRIEIIVGVVLFACIFIGVMYQVLGRYFPSISWIGAGELALLSMIAMTFVMIGYLTGRNGHIVIGLFDQMLAGRRLFAALRIVSALIVLATSLALAYDAFVKVGTEWGRASAAIGIPLGILYIFALVGGLSAGLQSGWKVPYAHRPERKLDIVGADD